MSTQSDFIAALKAVVQGKNRKTLSALYKAAEGFTVTHDGARGTPSRQALDADLDALDEETGEDWSDRLEQSGFQQRVLDFLCGCRSEVRSGNVTEATLRLRQNRVELVYEHTRYTCTTSVFGNETLRFGETVKPMPPDEKAVSVLKRFKLLGLLLELKAKKFPYTEELGKILQERVNECAILFHPSMKGYSWSEAFLADDLWEASRDNPAWTAFVNSDDADEDIELFGRLLAKRNELRKNWVGAIEVHQYDATVWDLWNATEDHDHADTQDLCGSPMEIYRDDSLARALTDHKIGEITQGQFLAKIYRTHSRVSVVDFVNWLQERSNRSEFLKRACANRPGLYQCFLDLREMSLPYGDIEFLPNESVHLKGADGAQWTGPLARVKTAVLYKAPNETARRVRREANDGQLTYLTDTLFRQQWLVDIRPNARVYDYQMAWLQEVLPCIAAVAPKTSEETATKRFVQALCAHAEKYKDRGTMFRMSGLDRVECLGASVLRLSLDEFEKGTLPELKVRNFSLVPFLEQVKAEQFPYTDELGKKLREAFHNTCIALVPHGGGGGERAEVTKVFQATQDNPFWSQFASQEQHAELVRELRHLFTNREACLAKYVAGAQFAHGVTYLWDPFGTWRAVATSVSDYLSSTDAQAWHVRYERVPYFASVARACLNPPESRSLPSPDDGTARSAKEILELADCTRTENLVALTAMRNLLRDTTFLAFLERCRSLTSLRTLVSGCETLTFFPKFMEAMLPDGRVWVGAAADFGTGDFIAPRSEVHLETVRAIARKDYTKFAMLVSGKWVLLNEEATQRPESADWALSLNLPDPADVDSILATRVIEVLNATKRRREELRQKEVTGLLPSSGTVLLAQKDQRHVVARDHFLSDAPLVLGEMNLPLAFRVLQNGSAYLGEPSLRQQAIQCITDNYAKLWFVVDGDDLDDRHMRCEDLAYCNYTGLMNFLPSRDDFNDKFTDLMNWSYGTEVRRLREKGVLQFRMVTPYYVEVLLRRGDGARSRRLLTFVQFRDLVRDVVEELPEDLPPTQHRFFEWADSAVIEDVRNGVLAISKYLQWPFSIDEPRIFEEASAKCSFVRKALRESGAQGTQYDKLLAFLDYPRRELLKSQGVQWVALMGEGYLFLRDDGAVTEHPQYTPFTSLRFTEEGTLFGWILAQHSRDNPIGPEDVRRVVELATKPMSIYSPWLDRDIFPCYRGRRFLVHKAETDRIDDVLIEVKGRKDLLVSLGVVSFHVEFIGHNCHVVLHRADGATASVRLSEFATVLLNQTAEFTTARSTEMNNNTDDNKNAPSKLAQKAAAAKKVIELDLSAAGWRMAGSQATKLTRDGIVALLQRTFDPNGTNPGMAQRIAEVLDTDLGKAFVQLLLGAMFSAVPDLGPAAAPYTAVAQKLGQECRVAGIAGAGDEILDVIMGPLRKLMAQYMVGAPTSTPEVLPETAPAAPRELTPPHGSPAIYVEVEDKIEVPADKKSR